MGKKLNLELSTLTPLWTGGVEGKCEKIQETGIIGSLRWWYEVVVRGLGGWACDPTEKTCNFNAEKFKKNKNLAEAGLCDVCRVFGATGWKRAFKLNFNFDKESNDLFFNKELKIRIENNKGWFYKGGLFFKKGMLTIEPNHFVSNQEQILQKLNLIIKLINDWGGLGAKTQQGYGVVNSDSKFDQQTVLSALDSIINTKHSNNNNYPKKANLPRIDEFFFSKIRFKIDKVEKIFAQNNIRYSGNLEDYLNKNFIPIAPVVRYYLRGLLREKLLFNNQPNATARWRLLGVINGSYHDLDYGKIIYYCSNCNKRWDHNPKKREHQNCNGKPYELCTSCKGSGEKLKNKKIKMERYKSLINVSHAYKVGENEYEMRIWGWIPKELPGKIRRDTVLDNLKNWMERDNGELWKKIGFLNISSIEWREKESNEDGKKFLERLLEIG
ncbi:type III-B CRISPR module RAMP protein Cmr1 [Carboxydothermus islandicus]|uniref:Type III-B CRISPR module RAMP protein Cmr1 n=1 Tax=Carboxydothermus islandicus TaxID=661089 RepID=A0A1L8D0E2_9THEO|nr:type III-B CRISPR module RAMP protein Cmr1 [Carboxydothermus islandicus]GAV24614.1 type III-B CRISPR module RAMP protein Cmr1 [Carboxydothermus islandicus]